MASLQEVVRLLKKIVTPFEEVVAPFEKVVALLDEADTPGSYFLIRRESTR